MGLKTVTIYGASDDLVEVEGEIAGADEFNPLDLLSDGKPWVATLVSESSSAGLVVVVAYVATGTWAVGVAPLEDVTFPAEWVVSLTRHDDPDYSCRLVLQVPDDTVLTPIT